MLVPLDGSELAEVVFTYAKELAGRLGIDVVLLHVFTPEERDFTPLHRAYIEHAAEIIKRESRKVQKKTGIPPGGKPIEVRSELATGSSAEAILRYAKERAVDLILIATHGRTGVRHWAIGDIADKVLRGTKVPVLLVRAGIPDEIIYDRWPKKTILVPLDGSKLSETVLPHVEVLAKQRGAEHVEVVLLRVCEPPAIPTYYTPELPDAPLNWGEYIQQETSRARRVATEYLAQMESRFKDNNINVRSEILVGKAADEIINYVNKNPFNLIVMATHGRSGLRRLVYGSVTENVLLSVSSPILLVKPE